LNPTSKQSFSKASRLLSFVLQQNEEPTMKHLLANLAELAERRAINVRAEAQIWDILARDLKRAYKDQAELKKHLPVFPKVDGPSENFESEERLYVRIKEAQKLMGMGRSSIYKEINAGRLPIKKAGRGTYIAIKDIHAWFAALPSKSH
jgi:predicted DNA-binding transcriptional regulator AlpA